MPATPEPTTRRRRGGRGLLAGLLLLAAALAGALLFLRRPVGGEGDPRRAVERFVAAAAGRDRAAVLRLARRGPDPADVEEAFALVPAATRLESVAVDQPFGPDVAFADARGASDGRPWQGRFTLNRRSGRWFVAVGVVPGSRTPSSTRRPQ